MRCFLRRFSLCVIFVQGWTGKGTHDSMWAYGRSWVQPLPNTHSRCLPQHMCWRHLKTNRGITTRVPLLQTSVTQHYNLLLSCFWNSWTSSVMPPYTALTTSVFLFYHKTITILENWKELSQFKECWMVARIWNSCDGASLSSEKRLEYLYIMHVMLCMCSLWIIAVYYSKGYDGMLYIFWAIVL